MHQQTEVIKKHTPLRVKGYYGQLGVDAWDLNVWVTEFKEHDVLVMTAQIYYNVILHAYWSIKDVSTLHRRFACFLTSVFQDCSYNIRRSSSLPEEPCLRKNHVRSLQNDPLRGSTKNIGTDGESNLECEESSSCNLVSCLPLQH